MMTARAALLGVRGGAAAPFDPLSLGWDVFAQKPNYNPGTITWAADEGSDLGAPVNPGSSGGAPVFDFSTDGNRQLSSMDAYSGWASTGDHHLFARVDLNVITTGSPASVSYLNAGAICDAGGYLGLHFRVDVSNNYYAAMYEFDTSTSIAEVDITALLTAGVGPITVQGRKVGGVLQIKVGSAAWVTGDACDPTGGGGGPVVGFKFDGAILAVGGRVGALSDGDSALMATWGAAL